MPTTMPHASIGEALDVLQKQDMAISSIPEIDSVVGKIGRVESALDPAPIGMIETVINYKSEYIVDEAGRRISFRYDSADGRVSARPERPADPGPARQAVPAVARATSARPTTSGRRSSQAAEIPGTTSAPKLQPIAAASSCSKAACGPPWASRSKGRTWRPSSGSALRSSGSSRKSRRRAGHRHRRPDRRQALSGDRARPPGAGPLRRAHPAVPGRPRGGHRRHQGDHDRRGPPAVPRAGALPAGTARQHRGAGADPGPVAGRRPDPADPTGRDPVCPRARGDQERGHVPGRLRPVRQEGRDAEVDVVEAAGRLIQAKGGQRRVSRGRRA